VTIKDGRTDQSLGTAAHIIFEGENEVIDRRAITFSGEKKKDKAKEGEDKAEGGEGEGKGGKKQLDENDPAFWEGGPKKKSPAEEEEEVDQKRGCGCRLANSDHSDRTALLGASLVAIAALRRRKRAA